MTPLLCGLLAALALWVLQKGYADRIDAWLKAWGEQEPAPHSAAPRQEA